jgi:hypothetical protein
MEQPKRVFCLLLPPVRWECDAMGRDENRNGKISAAGSLLPAEKVGTGKWNSN